MLPIVKKRRPKLSDQKSASATEVEFTFGLPPSTNELYIKRRGTRGQLALSTVAKNYKQHVKSRIAESVVALSKLPVSPEHIYRFDLTMYLEKVENPGWFERYTKGARAGERKAKTRYKRIDIDNRQKFVQDCVAKSLGFDDCQFFEGAHRKMQGTPERVIVKVEVLSDLSCLGEPNG